jgi:hypothetical protein
MFGIKKAFKNIALSLWPLVSMNGKCLLLGYK